MKLLMTLTAVLLLTGFWATPGWSQDWKVDGEISIEDLGDAGTDNDNNSLVNQPKIQSYEPFLELDQGGSSIGFGTVDYSKDSDPYGEYVITITSASVGALDVVYTLGHEIIDVSVGMFQMRSTLSVELIDTGGGGVTLTASGALLAPAVTEDDGFADEDVPLPTLALGIDEILIGEDTYTFDSGILDYRGTTTTVAMLLAGNFQLTAGDTAILRGRFEIERDQVPVNATNVSEVKARYTK